MKVKFFITSLLVMFSLSIKAEWIKVDGISYATSSMTSMWDSEGLIVVSGKDCVGDVVIPDTIEYEGTKYAVRAIGKDAFGYRDLINYLSNTENTKITSITIPRTIVEIQNDAFWQCTALTDVKISDLSAWCKIAFKNGYANPTLYSKKLSLNGNPISSLTIPSDIDKVLSYTFEGCKCITSLNIPDNVVNIWEKSFNGCSNISDVNIGKGLRSVGISAFSNCYFDYLNITDMESWLKVHWAIDDWGVYYPKTYRFMLNGAVVTSLKVPSSITVINGGAFSSMVNLKSIEIPNTVSEICDYGFYACQNIETLNIPNSVTSIGAYAFTSCTKLKTVTLPANIKIIKKHTFSGSAIQSIDLPDSITSLGDEAFYYCKELTNVNWPSCLKSIGNSCFEGCTNLDTPIQISNCFETCGKYAFRECTKIKDYYVEDLSQWCKIDGLSYLRWTFTGSSGYLQSFNLYQNDKLCKNIIVPEDVTEEQMLSDAFDGCLSMDSLKIHGGISKVTSFDRCSNLSYVDMQEGVKRIGNAFNGSKIKTINIPKSMLTIDCTNLQYLEDVYYAGTEEEWELITGIENIPSSATIHFQSQCGINDIIANPDNEDSVISTYSLDGRRTDKLHSGINIISYKNGSVHKVIVK